MIEPQNTQEEAQRLITQAMNEIQDRKKVRAEIEKSAGSTLTRERATQMGLALTVPILIAVLVMNFTGWSLKSVFEPRPSASAAREEAQKSLDALVFDIEAFREDYNELPETLAEAGMPSRGKWNYTVIGHGHYKIQGTLYGQGVSFDSTRATARSVKERP